MGASSAGRRTYDTSIADWGADGSGSIPTAVSSTGRVALIGCRGHGPNPDPSLASTRLARTRLCSQPRRCPTSSRRWILDRCAQSNVPELLRLARTLDTWRDELLAAFTTTGRRRVSNGPTEAVNALIKKVKRVGHGFRNLDNYRLRVLLNAGVDWNTVTWQAAPATPIRGRYPRFVRRAG